MTQNTEFRRFIFLALIAAGVAMAPARAGYSSLTSKTAKITSSFCYGLKK
jgi:hypothetical protein